MAARGAVARPGSARRLPVMRSAATVVAGSGGAARFVDGVIAVPPGPRETAPRIQGVADRARSRDRLVRAVAVSLAASTCAGARAVETLRDPRSRGAAACSSRGDLMLSWRGLIMGADAGAWIDVAAHEVAHLVEIHHSDAFWRSARGAAPRLPRPRANWLKRHGAEILAWRFEFAEEMLPSENPAPDRTGGGGGPITGLPRLAHPRNHAWSRSGVARR